MFYEYICRVKNAESTEHVGAAPQRGLQQIWALHEPGEVQRGAERCRQTTHQIHDKAPANVPKL